MRNAIIFSVISFFFFFSSCYTPKKIKVKADEFNSYHFIFMDSVQGYTGILKDADFFNEMKNFIFQNKDRLYRPVPESSQRIFLQVGEVEIAEEEEKTLLYIGLEKRYSYLDFEREVLVFMFTYKDKTQVKLVFNQKAKLIETLIIQVVDTESVPDEIEESNYITFFRAYIEDYDKAENQKDQK